MKAEATPPWLVGLPQLLLRAIDAHRRRFPGRTLSARLQRRIGRAYCRAAAAKLVRQELKTMTLDKMTVAPEVAAKDAQRYAVMCIRADDGRHKVFQTYANQAEAESVAARLCAVGCHATVEAALCT